MRIHNIAESLTFYAFFRSDEFRKLGCEVIACSTDSHFSHLAWCEKSRKQGGLGDMKIPLLADKSMAISRAYGVLKVAFLPSTGPRRSQGSFLPSDSLRRTVRYSR
jgi:peroxiredoxin